MKKSVYCMNKKDLERFFTRLDELLEIVGCNARDLTNAENILKEMDISINESQEFLDDCRSSGGFCDCEIFLNSEEFLREKYSS